MRISVPTSVTTGVLPLSAKAHGAAGDVERAAFLVASLARRWRDTAPFRLIVVTPSADIGPVAAALPASPRIHIELLDEQAFFGPRDAFHGLPGWWKQQVIKLVVPAVLQVGPYLTFDADVVCVGDFDGRTFVRGGKLRSQWYRQHRNGWWAATTRRLGLPYDGAAPGMDVTPNVLHSDLSARVLWRLALMGLGIRSGGLKVVPGPVRRAATRQLRDWYEEAQARARSGHVVHEDTWTEYALYTLLSGEGLQRTHTPASDDMPLLAHSHSIWYPAERSHLDRYVPSTRPDAPFAVVQSTSGVSLDEVRAAVGRLP
jgi:hypothetical protein